MKDIKSLVKNLLFSTAGIVECFENESKAFYWIRKSIKNGEIVKIRRDLYALVNPATGLIYADKYMLGSNINKTAYIGYHGALEFHGYANQVYNTVYVASDERFSNFEYGGISYERTKSSISLGIHTIKSSIDIRVTDLERTIIDCIDDTERAGGSEELINAISYINSLDYSKLLIYLRAYNKCNLWQKTGYLLEKFNSTLSLPTFFFEECNKNVSKHTIYYMSESIFGGVEYNKNWNIVAPKSFEME